MLPFLLVGTAMWWIGEWYALAMWGFCLVVYLTFVSERVGAKR